MQDTLIIKSSDLSLKLDEPKIMGILNVTPDSFSDGGSYHSVAEAVDRAALMAEEGAAIIDIGGESTRPGATPVSLETELSRVVPVVSALHRQIPSLMLSIDTSQPEVIEACVAEGAHLWNDIRALKSKGALEMAAKLKIPVILMHMQGEPSYMQENPTYTKVTDEVIAFLKERADACLKVGIDRTDIILDPGFGFGKTCEDNFALLSDFECLKSLGYPLLCALSRKSMFGTLLGIEDPVERLIPTVAANLFAVQHGANLIRVHDVKAHAQALAVLRQCLKP